MTIRELEAREIEKIYREEMTGDFPAEELKPIDLILRLKAEGRYCAFGNFEGEKLTAYAFLIHEKDERRKWKILTLMSRSTVKARMRALRMYPRRTAPVFTI